MCASLGGAKPTTAIRVMLGYVYLQSTALLRAQHPVLQLASQSDAPLSVHGHHHHDDICVVSVF